MNIAGIVIGLGLCVYWLRGAGQESSPAQRRSPDAKGSAWDNGRRKKHATRTPGAISGSANRPWDKDNSSQSDGDKGEPNDTSNPTTT